MRGRQEEEEDRDGAVMSVMQVASPDGSSSSSALPH